MAPTFKPFASWLSDSGAATDTLHVLPTGNAAVEMVEVSLDLRQKSARTELQPLLVRVLLWRG